MPNPTRVPASIFRDGTGKDKARGIFMKLTATAVSPLLLVSSQRLIFLALGNLTYCHILAKENMGLSGIM